VEVLGSVLGVKNRQVLGPRLGLEARVLVNIPGTDCTRLSDTFLLVMFSDVIDIRRSALT